jgi:hypothetical protein
MTLQHFSRTFANLLLKGKVNAAYRQLNEQSSGCILHLTEETSQDDNPAIMLDEDIPFVDPALFTNFDE